MTTRTQPSPSKKDLVSNRSVLSLVATFLIIAGATVWILNLEGIVSGSWSIILPVAFTTLSALLALLQLQQQKTLGERPFTKMMTPKSWLQVDGIDLGVDGYKGALVIKGNKQLRGRSLSLYRGFDLPNLEPDFASIVSEYKINGRPTLAGIFPSLEPGKYIVSDGSQQRNARVTVYPCTSTIVDWQ